MRTDMEQYYKGVAKMENWELSQMGGIKRRRGLRRVRQTLSVYSKLIPYVYSYADGDNMRYIIEVAPTQVRVMNDKGEPVKTFTRGVSKDEESGSIINFDFRNGFRHQQIGKMMLLTSQDNPVMVVERSESGMWNMREWTFKHLPWRYEEERDTEVILNPDYSVSFSNDEDGNETNLRLSVADYIRISYWIEQAEATSNGADLRKNVKVVKDFPATATKGDKFAIATGMTTEYFVCTADWETKNYVASLDSPVNYPNNFLAAETTDDFEDITPVYSINDAPSKDGKIAKGDKIAIKSGYWEYYTCIKDFTYQSGKDKKFAAYPDYFVRGIAVGSALPCMGEWEFLCSGSWYGSYEVRRHFSKTAIDSDWEPRGMSFSRIAAASNTIVTGTEADEECYLRLFLTRSKRVHDNNIAAGFPMDICGNRLIVKGYKHSAIIKATPTTDGDITWRCTNKVKPVMVSERKSSDWSWQAFSARYGFPLHSIVFNKRLVFASTKHQPQTLWFSRTDDLDNFLTGDIDTASIVVSMDTPSQNPICWIHSRTLNLMVGTCEGEFIINTGRAQGGVTSSNITLENHGFVGSHEIHSVGVNDKVIFIERGSGRAREYGYSLEADGYRSIDLSVFAPHILKEHGGVQDLAVTRKPDTVLMMVLKDGQLALCVYNSFHNVKGWHRWKTDGEFKAVCCMPDGNNDDKIFFVVWHRYNSGLQSWIEVIDKDSNYLDHGVDYVSYLETNSLTNALEQRPAKDNKPRFWMHMGKEFEKKNDNFNLSTNKGVTWRWDANHESVIPKGWKEYTVPCGWDYECTVSVRVKGNNACEILALTR